VPEIEGASLLDDCVASVEAGGTAPWSGCEQAANIPTASATITHHIPCFIATPGSTKPFYKHQTCNRLWAIRAGVSCSEPKPPTPQQRYQGQFALWQLATNCPWHLFSVGCPVPILPFSRRFSVIPIHESGRAE